MDVPANQRSYSWGKREIAAFLADINNQITSGTDFYYLGPVVLRSVKDSDRLQVVDGQQRLMSTTILLSVIRDYAVMDGRENTAAKIEREYLKTEAIWDDQFDSRLRVNALDQDFFVNHIISRDGGDNPPPTKRSHHRLLAARLAFKNHFDVLDPASLMQALERWEGFLLHSAKALVCQFGPETNPYTLFETLNERGLKPSVAELVKNYLFGVAEAKLDSAMQLWSEMVGILEAVDAPGPDDILNVFLRQVWISRHGRIVRTASVFGEVRSAYETPTAALKFCTELRDIAKLYHKILSASETEWKKYGHDCADYMDAINAMGMVQVRPLILVILQRFDEKEIQPALKVLVAASMRLLVSKSAGTGFMESNYASVIASINSGAVKNSSALRSSLRVFVPSDEEFEVEFASARLSKKTLIRYALRALENQRTGKGRPALVPNPSADVVNIEHVLPQKPLNPNQWPLFKGDDLKTFTSRIGNLALMQVKLNSKIGNSEFSIKRPYLTAEPFELTKSIGISNEWSPADVNRRQKELAVLALKVWVV